MITRIIVGMLVSILGLAMVWKTEFFMNALGEVEWALRYLGGGGTRLFYKLLGVAIIMIGFLVVTNLWSDFVGGIVHGLFG